MPRLAIFDCDGTLVDSGAAIHRALTHSLETHRRLVPPLWEAKRVIGLSLNQAFQMLAPDADAPEIGELAETYRSTFQQLRASGQVEEPLFPGIMGLLDALEADAWLLAVATGKSDRGLRHCLELNGLSGRFVSLQTADRHPSKPHPAMAIAAMTQAGTEPGDTVMIGDTGWDMGLARAARIAALGVGWGYHDEAELLREGAQAIAQEPMELLALARDWVGEAA